MISSSWTHNHLHTSVTRAHTRTSSPLSISRMHSLRPFVRPSLSLSLSLREEVSGITIKEWPPLSVAGSLAVVLWRFLRLGEARGLADGVRPVGVGVRVAGVQLGRPRLSLQALVLHGCEDLGLRLVSGVPAPLRDDLLRPESRPARARASERERATERGTSERSMDSESVEKKKRERGVGLTSRASTGASSWGGAPRARPRTRTSRRPGAPWPCRGPRRGRERRRSRSLPLPPCWDSCRRRRRPPLLLLVRARMCGREGEREGREHAEEGHVSVGTVAAAGPEAHHGSDPPPRHRAERSVSSRLGIEGQGASGIPVGPGRARRG